MQMFGAPRLAASKDERPAFFWSYAAVNGLFLYLGITIIAAGLRGTQ
jgi:hypothetical protein